MWVWYNLVGRGGEEMWKMGEGMRGDRGEVDVYEMGGNGGLGRGEKVSEWGWGGKEGGMSEGGWNGLYY